VQVTARLEDARAGDLITLVSNGLYNAISDAQMARILADGTTLEDIADHLIRVAQERHAADDISCILLRWIGGDEEPPRRVSAGGLNSIGRANALAAGRGRFRGGARHSPRQEN
jgi:serine/threonine protein phosphatase PrpC